MNLCLDIGNTRTKAAIFDPKGALVQLKITETTTKEYLNVIIDEFSVSNCIVSSVKIPNLIIEKHLADKLDFFIKLTDTTPIPIQNDYDTPKTLGKDRLAAIIGATTYYPSANVLVIDAGTCVTYDFMDEKNSYKGGGISPGIQMKFKALHHFTDQLPLVPFGGIGNLIGTDTRTSILSGVVWGMIAEVDGIIAHYRSFVPTLNVLLTGGDTDFFVGKLKNEIFAAPNLVLEGLNKIINYNVSKAL